MEEQIDAVITWVDGRDPEHINKRMKFIESNAYGLKKLYLDSSFKDDRFVSFDEVRYCIYSIRKNASWINKIYLVTDNQKPKWLCKHLEKELNVEIIDHKILFEGLECNLPTFCSRSIETLINKIPELSEKFIYFNDDFIIVNKVMPSDFFIDSKIVVRGRIGFINYYFDKISRILLYKWRDLGFVGRRPDCKLYKGIFYLDIAHAPFPLFKSVLDSCFSSSFQEINSSYKFRGVDQFWPIGLAVNFTARKFGYIFSPKDWLYVGNSCSNKHKTMKKINKIDSGRYKFLCLQNLNTYDNKTLNLIVEKLDSLLDISKH